MRMQGWHFLVLLLVVLLLFGVNRLPALAKSVGQSLKIFKREVQDLAEDDRPARTEAGTGPSASATPLADDVIRPVPARKDLDRDPGPQV